MTSFADRVHGPSFPDLFIVSKYDELSDFSGRGGKSDKLWGASDAGRRVLRLQVL